MASSQQQLQPPPVPNNWNYTVTQPYPDRLQAAKDAVLAGISNLDIYGRVPENGDGTDLEKTFAFYSIMGNFDAVANQSNFQAIAVEFLTTGFLECFGNPQCPGAEIQFIIQRGYAAICGYLAYKDENILHWAQIYWETANLYTISSSNSQLASGSLKNFSLVKECVRGLSLTGATFKSVGKDNSNVTLFETALFFRLSALMAVSSHGQNNTYILAAQQSAQFLMNTRGLSGYYHRTLDIDQVESGINVHMGDPTGCDTTQGSDAAFTTSPVDTSITGLLIEGLSYLFSLDMNSTIQEMILAVILDRLSPIMDYGFGDWSVPSGVLQKRYLPGNHSGDSFLLRGLSEASKISSLPSNVVDYIKAFIAAQYNALQAGSQPSHIYGCSWDTPPPSSYDFVNQTRSVQLLIDGISVFNETQSGTSSGPESTNTSTTSQPAQTPKAGVIAGGVVGGLTFILVLCVVIFLFCQQKRRELNHDATDQSPNNQEMVVSPFVWSPPGPQQAVEPSQSKKHTRPIPQHSQSEHVESYPSNYPSTSTAADPHERITANGIMPSTDGEASTPELIRLLYQRIWQPAGHENPPEYQSQLG